MRSLRDLGRRTGVSVHMTRNSTHSPSCSVFVLALASWLTIPATTHADVNPPPDLQVQVSPNGLGFVATEVRRKLPTRFEAPDFSQQLVDCPFTDHDTDLKASDISTRVQVRSLKIIPRKGRLEVLLRVRATGSAELQVTRPYGCVGYPLDCSADFSVSSAWATASFTPVFRGGRVRLDKPSINLVVPKANVQISISDCGLAAALANLVLPLFKGRIVKEVTAELEQTLLKDVPPQLERALADLSNVSGELPQLSVEGSLQSVAASTRGVAVGANVQVQPRQLATSCTLRPAPTTNPPAAAPQLGAHAEHVGLALSGAAIQRALQAAWRAGYLCADSARLRAQGLPHELPGWGAALIGLKGATTISLHAHSAPRVKLLPGAGARLRLTIPDATLVIDGVGAEGPTRITVTLTAALEAAVRIDPATRGVKLEVASTRFTDLSVTATREAGLRLNPMVLSMLINSTVSALLQAHVSELEIVPQVVHQSGGPLDAYYLYLARGGTDADYLKLYVSFFHRPTWDHRAPTSWLAGGAQRTLDRSGHVTLKASGSDDQTPAPLLRYQWRVDGGGWSAAGYNPTRRLQLSLGAHRVEVRAVDLNGNVDATPYEAQITVADEDPDDKGDWLGGAALDDATDDGGCAVVGGAGRARDRTLSLLLGALVLLSLSRRRIR